MSVPLEPKAQARGLGRVLRAASFSWAGLKAAWRREAAFRQELAGVLLLLPLALWLPPDAAGRALLVGSLAGVLVVELLNTAIEAVVDLASPGHHPLAGLAKDVGSAAVTVALLGAAAVWALVLWPR